MMSKLYYTDELAAAYMAREFGVTLAFKTTVYESPFGKGADEAHAANREYERLNPWHVIKYKKPNGLFKARSEYSSANSESPFYVHPDSLPIFEPQVGDIAFLCGEEAATIKRFVSSKKWYHYPTPMTSQFRRYQWLSWDDVPKKLAITENDEAFLSRHDKIIQRGGKPFFMPERKDE